MKNVSLDLATATLVILIKRLMENVLVKVVSILSENTNHVQCVRMDGLNMNILATRFSLEKPLKIPTGLSAKLREGTWHLSTP